MIHIPKEEFEYEENKDLDSCTELAKEATSASKTLTGKERDGVINYCLDLIKKYANAFMRIIDEKEFMQKLDDRVKLDK